MYSLLSSHILNRNHASRLAHCILQEERKPSNQTKGESKYVANGILHVWKVARNMKGAWLLKWYQTEVDHKIIFQMLKIHLQRERQ